MNVNILVLKGDGLNCENETAFAFRKNGGETKEIHIKDLSDSEHGDADDGFRQATVDFNSGSNTTLEIYALMHIIDASQLDKNADISEQTEVYIDDFSLTLKDD